MAQFISTEPSRTLMEFRLLPGYTTSESISENISLRTPLVYSNHSLTKFEINIPVVSAAMQSVSGSKMAIELAKAGGISFLFCSQSIESQTAMMRAVKHHKAGFVTPHTVNKNTSIERLHQLRTEHGFNTFPVVDDDGKFLGIITRNDYDINSHREMSVSDRMIPKQSLVTGTGITNLKAANSLLMESHQSVLPILDSNGKLSSLVFRKDIYDHLDNPAQVVDEKKRLLCGAAINTHDYKERVPALVNEGADILCIDSSDGYSEFQKETIKWITSNFPDTPVVAGNVVTAEGFRFLVENGAAAVKVGMGSGSICITQEQKGTGRGLATAIMKTAQERDKYFAETGKYIPICADGGIGNSKDISVALALGADYIMMGRYFARMEESPTEKIIINDRIMKPYWGEGSNRAREWHENRYSQSKFAEGVEGFVEYAGRLKDSLDVTISKIKSTLSTCGVSDIALLHANAQLEVVSALSIREGKVHDIFMPDKSSYPDSEGY